jgi:hypothetical protein
MKFLLSLTRRLQAINDREGNDTKTKYLLKELYKQ